MRLLFTRVLPARPALAWPYLAVPDLMNRWSLAPVRGISPGDGGHPGGTGALRRVHLPLPGPPVALDEVVVRADPPRELVYRVWRGALLEHHQGRITLAPIAEGTLLRWAVEVALAMPGAEAFARLVIAPQIAASLERLAEVVRHPAAASTPPRRAVDDAADLPALYAAAEAVAEEQRALAERFAAAGDDRRWFARAYLAVTEHQIAACRAGAFGHPAWVLRLVPRFHAYWAGGVLCDRAEAEEHWARARTGRGLWPPRPLRCLHRGMRAHIEDDLPRTLAEVWFAHYRGRCDYARFRADYLAMAPVFVAAARDFLGHLRAPPVRPDLLALLMEREFYPLARERRNAFERGGRIARLMEGAARRDGGAVPGVEPARARPSPDRRCATCGSRRSPRSTRASRPGSTGARSGSSRT